MSQVTPVFSTPHALYTNNRAETEWIEVQPRIAEVKSNASKDWEFELPRESVAITKDSPLKMDFRGSVSGGTTFAPTAGIGSIFDQRWLRIGNAYVEKIDSGAGLLDTTMRRLLYTQEDFNHGAILEGLEDTYADRAIAADTPTPYQFLPYKGHPLHQDFFPLYKLPVVKYRHRLNESVAEVTSTDGVGTVDNIQVDNAKYKLMTHRNEALEKSEENTPYEFHFISAVHKEDTILSGASTYEDRCQERFSSHFATLIVFRDQSTIDSTSNNDKNSAFVNPQPSQVEARLGKRIVNSVSIADDTGDHLQNLRQVVRHIDPTSEMYWVDKDFKTSKFMMAIPFGKFRGDRLVSGLDTRQKQDLRIKMDLDSASVTTDLKVDLYYLHDVIVKYDGTNVNVFN